MTEEHVSNSKNGVPIGTKAPIIDTVDVFDNPINLTELARANRGVVIDFFRGTW